MLDQAYASSVDLLSQVKQAQFLSHGRDSLPRFDSLGRICTRLLGHSEQIALRVSGIGGVPSVTLRMVARNSSLPEFEENDGDGIDALADRFELHASNLRRFIDLAVSLEEPVTAQMLSTICADCEEELARLDRYLTD